MIYKCPYCSNPADGDNDPCERVCWECADQDTVIDVGGFKSKMSFGMPKFYHTDPDLGANVFDFTYGTDEYYYSVKFKNSIATYYISLSNDIEGVSTLETPSTVMRGTFKVSEIEPKDILNKLHKIARMANFQ